MSTNDWIFLLTAVLVFETGVLVLYTPFGGQARNVIAGGGKAVAGVARRAYRRIRKRDRQAELKAMVAERFGAVPLRAAEVEMLWFAVQWALANPLADPFSGHNAIGVATQEGRRQNMQLFHIPIPMAGAIQNGWLEGDQSYENLDETLKVLKRLVEEVRYDIDYWRGHTNRRRV
jgi:hypothetical protein